MVSGFLCAATLQGHEDTLRTIGELARKKTSHSGEVNRKPFSAAAKRGWQSSALPSPTKTLNTDLAPNGDDIESVEVLTCNVTMSSEFLVARMSPKNPTS